MDASFETMPRGNSASGKRDYQSPRLSMLGDVGSLTEAGSAPGNEYDDFFDCTNDNSNMSNMC